MLALLPFCKSRCFHIFQCWTVWGVPGNEKCQPDLAFPVPVLQFSLKAQLAMCRPGKCALGLNFWSFTCRFAGANAGKEQSGSILFIKRGADCPPVMHRHDLSWNQAAPWAADPVKPGFLCICVFRVYSCLTRAELILLPFMQSPCQFPLFRRLFSQSLWELCVPASFAPLSNLVEIGKQVEKL